MYLYFAPALVMDALTMCCRVLMAKENLSRAWFGFIRTMTLFDSLHEWANFMNSGGKITIRGRLL